MKLSTLLSTSAVIVIGFLSSSVFAGGQFFEVGKSYLFVPRLDLVMKGTVTQITDHEIVFTNRSLLKATKATASAKNDDGKSASIKASAIAEYLKSEHKEALLESGPLSNIPTSYSRAEMTAIKLEG